MIESVKLAMLEAENLQLRKLLWLNHGCNITALYGDDGEMQCGACATHHRCFNESRLVTTNREVGLARAVLAAKHPERSVERTVVAEVLP